MKSTITRMLTILAIPATLAACQTTEQTMVEEEQTRLSATEISSIVSGKTNLWANSKGSSGTVSYEMDGSAVVNWGKGDDSGTWRVDVENNLLCSAWEHRENKEICAEVYKIADNAYKTIADGGAYTSEFSIK